MNNKLKEEFLDMFDLDDIGCIYRTLYNNDMMESFLEHKLIRYIGKGSIGKRAGAVQLGTKITQKHVDDKIYIKFTSKGEAVIKFNEL